MADKFDKSNSKYDALHLKRMASIESKVKAIYIKAAEDAALLGAGIKPKVSKPFKFEDYPEAKKKAEQLIQELGQGINTTIINGVQAEWTLANNKNSALADLVFGDNIGKLTEEQYRRYYSTNYEALQSFMVRKTAGLQLSDKVWKYTDGFKNEIEMALDLGIRSGKSAAEMSRDIRSYLQYPDKLFRRVRDEYGQLHLSKAAAAFHPSRGVYRSSYMNARRLAATETNIAYRTADHLRHQQLDFIVGIKICLSNNHNCKGVPAGMYFDICDELQGNYPKDFKFTGWHPHCRCHVETILKTPAELQLDTERILAGRPTAQYSRNAVKEIPVNFKKWVQSNKDRIVDAEGTRRMPYFLRDNAAIYGKILGAKTPKEIAAIRHANRTNDDEQAIRDAWHKRQAKYAAIETEAKAINTALAGISDVNTKALQNALARYDLNAVQAETAKLKQIQAEISALSKLDDPLKVARDFSLAEAKAVDDAVISRMGREHFASLTAEKHWLETEINWVKDHKKYRTWSAAIDAYKKELAIISERIEIDEISTRVTDALAYATTSRSKAYRGLVDEMRAILSSSKIDVKAAKAKSDALINKFQELQAQAKKTTIAKTKSAYAVKHETLKELNKRLGADFPKTLPNLEKAIASYENTGKYGYKAKKYKTEIEKLMIELFDTHDLGMNIDDVTLEKVLNTKFKNLFEVGTGNGATPEAGKTTGKIGSGNSRLQAAHNLFGLGDRMKKQLARTEYEKYGNMLDHNIKESMRHNTATQYGNVEVRFKKDKVTCTWTAGDSLSQIYQPSLVSDPKSCSFDDLNKTPTSSSIDVTNLAEFKKNHISGYLELQYHGELTADCVESITFPYELKTSHFESVALKWKVQGVDVYFIGNDHELHKF